MNRLVMKIWDMRYSQLIYNSLSHALAHFPKSLGTMTEDERDVNFDSGIKYQSFRKTLGICARFWPAWPGWCLRWRRIYILWQDIVAWNFIHYSMKVSQKTQRFWRTIAANVCQYCPRLFRDPQYKPADEIGREYLMNLPAREQLWVVPLQDLAQASEVKWKTLATKISTPEEDELKKAVSQYGRCVHRVHRGCYGDFRRCGSDNTWSRAGPVVQNSWLRKFCKDIVKLEADLTEKAKVCRGILPQRCKTKHMTTYLDKHGNYPGEDGLVSIKMLILREVGITCWDSATTILMRYHQESQNCGYCQDRVVVS